MKLSNLPHARTRTVKASLLNKRQSSTNTVFPGFSTSITPSPNKQGCMCTTATLLKPLIIHVYRKPSSQESTVRTYTPSFKTIDYHENKLLRVATATVRTLSRFYLHGRQQQPLIREITNVHIAPLGLKLRLWKTITLSNFLGRSMPTIDSSYIQRRYDTNQVEELLKIVKCVINNCAVSRPYSSIDNKLQFHAGLLV